MNTIPLSPDRMIIQGGMGVYISTPFLAKTVSMNGGLGTVSGVAAERLLATILQNGDVGGHYRRALAHFPFPNISKMVLDEFFVEEGNPRGVSKRGVPVFTVNPSRILISLTICANYAFVWLAKEGHENPVSVNYLEKIAMPHIYALTGALLAGVDFVTMGAGIPLLIPELMRNIIDGKEASYRIPVEGTSITSHTMRFSPEEFLGGKLPLMKLPGFIPIIASNLLATIFMTKVPEGSVQGFVIEEPTAGGHNAPPRTRIPDETGAVQLVYGKKDAVDYAKIAACGLPFWIGGSYASPERLAYARSIGAVGIQAGSIFALSHDSGMNVEIRQEVCKRGFKGTLVIRTDMSISPTGFPFKVAVIPSTVAESAVYDARTRGCDQGALVTLYEKPDGSIGYRCPSEPVASYVHKGGKEERAIGCGCVCNGLIANTILGNPGEFPLVTLGDDVGFLKHLMDHSRDSYGVSDALAYLLCKV